MAFPVEVIATLALILSIWNTIILLRRRLVRAEDFITLLELIAEATPNPYDDRIVERIKELIEKYRGRKVKRHE